MSLTPYMRELQPRGVTFSVAKRLISVERDGNQIKARISSDYCEDMVEERNFDQIVVNHGIVPLAGVYFDLAPHSSNGGEVDHDALVEGRVQEISRNVEGSFQLFRIGDAVSSRNIHAAVLDGFRFSRTL